jgi:hypothetical protein
LAAGEFGPLSEFRGRGCEGFGMFESAAKAAQRFENLQALEESIRVKVINTRKSDGQCFAVAWEWYAEPNPETRHQVI